MQPEPQHVQVKPAVEAAAVCIIRLVQLDLRGIQPGSGSVVCELHFNAGPEKATGVECLVPAKANAEERALADAICAAVTRLSGIVNRGVKDETQSHRGRLGILHSGAKISVLPELCFITNRLDLQAYRKAKDDIAKDIAILLVRADAWFK